MKLSVLLLLLLGLLACSGSYEGEPIPLDRLYYPSVILKNSNTLYVLNANLDQRYTTGSFLTIDATTGQIQAGVQTPSLPGRMISNASMRAFLLTDQKKASLHSLNPDQVLGLNFAAPYYLAFVPGQTTGYLGYFAPAFMEPWGPGRFSLLADSAEVQVIQWTASGIQVLQNRPLSACVDTEQNAKYRRTGRLGALLVNQGKLYALAEYMTSPQFRPEKHVFLVTWQTGSDCTAIDLTSTLSAQSARDMVISSDGQTAYMLLDDNSLLVKVNLDETPIKFQKEKTLCSNPSKLAMSPDGNSLFVLCSEKNQIEVYNTADLTQFGSYQGGVNGVDALGPVDIVLESAQAWVLFQKSHQIGIFNYANAPSGSRFFSSVSWLPVPR